MEWKGGKDPWSSASKNRLEPPSESAERARLGTAARRISPDTRRGPGSCCRAPDLSPPTCEPTRNQYQGGVVQARWCQSHCQTREVAEKWKRSRPMERGESRTPLNESLFFNKELFR